MKKYVVAIAALAFLLGSTAAFADATPDGAALYKAKCALCHGPDGKGQTAMGKANKLRNLGAADVQKESDQALGDIVLNGKGKMPAYKGKLTPEEIKSVVGFIRTLKK